nr:hypothetical protein B24M22.140 [imported] - Neurospora crassa [Neurospora crassa]
MSTSTVNGSALSSAENDGNCKVAEEVPRRSSKHPWLFDPIALASPVASTHMKSRAVIMVGWPPVSGLFFPEGLGHQRDCRQIMRNLFISYGSRDWRLLPRKLLSIELEVCQSFSILVADFVSLVRSQEQYKVKSLDQWSSRTSRQSKLDCRIANFFARPNGRNNAVLRVHYGHEPPPSHTRIPRGGYSNAKKESTVYVSLWSATPTYLPNVCPDGKVESTPQELRMSDYLYLILIWQIPPFQKSAVDVGKRLKSYNEPLTDGMSYYMYSRTPLGTDVRPSLLEVGRRSPKSEALHVAAEVKIGVLHRKVEKSGLGARGLRLTARIWRRFFLGNRLPLIFETAFRLYEAARIVIDVWESIKEVAALLHHWTVMPRLAQLLLPSPA